MITRQDVIKEALALGKHNQTGLDLLIALSNAFPEEELYQVALAIEEAKESGELVLHWHSEEGAPYVYSWRWVPKDTNAEGKRIVALPLAEPEEEPDAEADEYEWWIGNVVPPRKLEDRYPGRWGEL